MNNNGFNTPHTKAFDINDDLDIKGMSFPIIVKPSDSSGSKGVTVLKNADQLQEAVEFAFSFSRSKKIIIEEFIEKNHPYLVGGDIFVIDGKIALWGLLNCHRDNTVNPLVPVGKSYPLDLSSMDEQVAKETLQRMVTLSGFRNGAMNVELVIDKNHKCWLIDIGPRNGGNMIPDLLGYIFDIDIVEMTIRSAMGEQIIPEKYYATYNLHSNQSGHFQSIEFAQRIEPYIIRKEIYKKSGDKVRFFNNASDAIGIIFMKFPDKETMDDIFTNIHDLININVY